MSTQNLAGIDAILKNVYKGPLVEQLNQETQMLDTLTKTNANDLGQFRGRQVVVPVHSGRNRGRGGMVDGGNLSTAGTQGTADAIITIKYFNGGVELSDQAILQSQSDVGAFMAGLELEVEGCKNDVKKDVCRIVFGTGDGLLASCTTTQATVNTFAVDSGQYIAINDTVDIIVRSSGATGTGALARTVTAVTYTGSPNTAGQANANVTVSGGTISVDNTYGVYLAGDRANESDGLQNILSTGRTLHQINSATAGNGYWDSNVRDFANAAPSEDGLAALAQTCRQRSNGGTPDLGVLTLGGFRRLANTFLANRRLNDKDALTIDGGWETLSVSVGGKAIPFIGDVDCPNGKGFELNRSKFGWTQIAEPDFIKAPDGNGVYWQLKSAGTGTWSRIWQTWLIWDAVLYCLAPNQSGKVIGMFDDVPVSRQ